MGGGGGRESAVNETDRGVEFAEAEGGRDDGTTVLFTIAGRKKIERADGKLAALGKK